MRLLGYARASAGKDAWLQIDSLMSQGVEPHDVFFEVASVAKDRPDPPAMRRLLEYAEEGDAIVVWRIDRLGRSLSEVLDTVALLRDRGVNLRSVHDVIDSSTTPGRLMLDLLASLAEYDRFLANERISAGMASARQAGKRLGRPPVEPDAVRKKLHVVEDARSRGLTAAQAAQLVGWSRATYYRHQRQVGTQP